MFPLQHFIRIKNVDQYITKTIKNRSRRILRLWTDQCEYIIAQRFRRGQQMICLYRRIWDETALRGIIQQIRKQVSIETEREKKNIFFCSQTFFNFFINRCDTWVIASILRNAKNN